MRAGAVSIVPLKFLLLDTPISICVSSLGFIMASPPSDVTRMARFLLVECRLPVCPGLPRSVDRLRPPDTLAALPRRSRSRDEAQESN